jgi:hypothetical protein
VNAEKDEKLMLELGHSIIIEVNLRIFSLNVLRKLY